MCAVIVWFSLVKIQRRQSAVIPVSVGSPDLVDHSEPLH